MKHVLVLAALAALCGCASTAPVPDETASIKPAVYLLNSGSDGAGADRLAETSTDGQKSTVPGASKLVRIYWFLGGR